MEGAPDTARSCARTAREAPSVIQLTNGRPDTQLTTPTNETIKQIKRSLILMNLPRPAGIGQGRTEV